MSLTKSKPTARAHRWREVGLAVGLTVLVTLYEMWVLHLPYARYFEYSLWADSRLVVCLHVVGVLAIAAVQGLFFWAALVSPRRWQVVYLTVFGCATFVEFGYARATQALTNAHDLEVAWENTRYWSAMIGAFVNWQAAGSVAIVLIALSVSRPLPSGHLRRAAGVFLMTLLVHSAYAMNGFLRRAPDVGMTGGAQVPTGAFQAFARSLTMLGWNRAVNSFQYQLRESVLYKAAAIPTHHVVLVIDESISAGHLSLNGYPRPTTPWLTDLTTRDLLTNWGVAAAATNNSNGSVLCMLTGVNALPDVGRRSLAQPTVFQYAKAMNYQTHLLDGEASARRFGISWDDLRSVDDFRSAQAFGDDPDTDFRMARVVADLLKSPAGQFIVVLKRGNHFPHKSNYPAGRGEWRPSSDGAVPAGKESAALTNTYDNAIRYNLDTFFRTMLGPDGSLPRSALLYTSDHGEVLSDEGSEPLARAVAWGVAAVPLLMLGDDRVTGDSTYRASHHNVFPTLLDLMNVPASIRSGSLARSLVAARGSDRDRRLVLDGFLLGTQGFTVHDFDGFTRPKGLGPTRERE